MQTARLTNTGSDAPTAGTIKFYFRDANRRPVSITPNYQALDSIRKDYPQFARILDRAMVSWTSGAVGVRRFSTGTRASGGRFVADTYHNPACCLTGAAMLGLDTATVEDELGITGTGPNGDRWTLAATGENGIAMIGFGFDTSDCRDNLHAFGAKVAAALNLPAE